MRALYHFPTQCNGFGKKKQIKVSVRTALAQEFFMVALD